MNLFILGFLQIGEALDFSLFCIGKIELVLFCKIFDLIVQRIDFIFSVILNLKAQSGHLCFMSLLKMFFLFF